MTHPDIQCLQRIRSLSQFETPQLEELAGRLEITPARPGEVLIERGGTEQFSLYLLEGSLSAVSADGKETRFDAATGGELIPIAQLRPSIYRVAAATPAVCLRIDPSLLTEFAHQVAPEEGSMEVIEIEQSAGENALTIQLFQDLMTGQISLPSLPPVAARIQQAFDDENVSAESIGQIVQADPAITAKLIMTANSALYRGQAKIDSVQQAITRLGLDTTRKLVMTYVVKELFQARDAGVRARMQELWKHSQQVACLSRLLAGQVDGFDAEQAQLAGLVHDLGAVAILAYAQDHPELLEDPEALDASLANLRPQITGMLLNQWNFGPEFVTAGEECEDWFRNPADTADLCDLVLIAQYHALIGSDAMRGLPPASKLPAFAKLGMANLQVSQIIEFLKRSRSEIDAIEAHLAAI